MRTTDDGIQPERRRHAADSWEQQRDALLSRRISDLELRVQGSPVERLVERLYAELAERGLVFRAFLTQPEPVHAILHHLGLPTRPLPLSPARGPPALALDFDAELDQTPAFDPADPELIPNFDFDQTRGR